MNDGGHRSAGGAGPDPVREWPGPDQGQLRRWTLNWRPDPCSRSRLFCFPHAGGGAAAYAGWQEALAGAGVEVCALELPGRLARLGEQPFHSVERLVATAADVLGPLLRPPFALYGHSMGALLAFELARQLRRRGRPSPRCLMVSAFPGPTRVAGRHRAEGRSDEAVLAGLARSCGPLPAEVLARPELVDLVLGILRSDFDLLDRYRYQADEPLDCAIVAFGGHQDLAVDADDLNAWRLETSDFRLEMVPGGHLFLNSHREELLPRVVQALAR